MTQDTNDSRYEDILHRIASRKPFGVSTKKTPKSAYDIILDGLNAYDTLSQLSLRTYLHILVHGPKVVRQATWSGVVIWCRNKGYYGYRVLTLVGVWAHQVDDGIYLTIGSRSLPYRAPLYNAEGYHASIRKGFKLFYEDNGSPPNQDDMLYFQGLYDMKKRLIYRQTFDHFVQDWQSKHTKS